MKTDYERNRMLNGRYGGGTYVKAATVYLALFSAAPSRAGTYTEVAYTGYARVAKTNNNTNFPAPPNPSQGVTSNATVCTFPERDPGGGTVTATHFGWLDAATPGTGNLQDFDVLSEAKVIGVGDTPEFGIGTLVWTET